TRLLTILLCCSLLSSTLVVAVPTPISANSRDRLGDGSAKGLFGSILVPQGGGPPSVPGPNLPDLDAARSVQPSDPTAPPPIASNQACADCTPCPTCGPGTSNHAPVARSGGPYYGTAGTAIIFNGLGSFDVDPGDGISAYAWGFGDNTTAVHGVMPSH